MPTQINVSAENEPTAYRKPAPQVNQNYNEFSFPGLSGYNAGPPAPKKNQRNHPHQNQNDQWGAPLPSKKKEKTFGGLGMPTQIIISDEDEPTAYRKPVPQNN